MRTDGNTTHDIQGGRKIDHQLCLAPDNICYSMTIRVNRKRQLKETLYIRHSNTVEPMMVTKDRPPPISNSQKDLIRKERSTLAQLRSGYWGLLASYKSRIKKDASLNACDNCGMTPHDVKHLFVCSAQSVSALD